MAEGHRAVDRSRSGRSSCGSCPSGSLDSATGPRGRSTGASLPGSLFRNSDGLRLGPPRSRTGSSSRGGGRGRGNRVPLYGHRNPRDPWLDAVSSTPARWRVPDRGCGDGSENGTRGASSGVGRSRVAWPFVLLETAAIVFSGASSSTSRPLSGRPGCRIWRGDGLEDGEQIASRSPSGGTCARGHLATESLSPGPRCDKDDLGVFFLASARSMREPRAESRLPFFIPWGCSRVGYRKLSAAVAGIPSRAFPLPRSLAFSDRPSSSRSPAEGGAGKGGVGRTTSRNPWRTFSKKRWIYFPPRPVRKFPPRP